MKELTLVSQAHAQLDGEYARRLFRAIARNHTQAEARYAELRRINDGAYFLIIFGTFERYIADRADFTVKVRTANQNITSDAPGKRSLMAPGSRRHS